ncbi:hypothetical protein OAM01_01005 [bacterium]|nr:hypothetical protein [bacterium]
MNDSRFFISLQRDEKGQLTPDSLAEVSTAIRQCMGSVSPQSIDCICAIGSGGLSLRTMELPFVKEAAFQNLLELQIEKEWPLSPDELAWGFVRLDEVKEGSDSVDAHSSKLAVAAVKKSLFHHYDEIVRACGLQPRWTLSACAGLLITETEGSQNNWLLDLRSSVSDLIELQGGIPVSLQHLNWGWDNFEARLQRYFKEETKFSPEVIQKRLQEIEDTTLLEWLGPIIEGLSGADNGGPIIVAGEEVRAPIVQSILQRTMPGREVKCSLVASSPAASLPLQVFSQHHKLLETAPLITLKKGDVSSEPVQVAHIPYLRWAAMLIMLVIVALLARRIEPSLRSSKLEGQLIEYREQKNFLPEIDRELSFLEHVQQKTIPYMDLVGLLAAKSVSGFQLESLEMSSDRRVQVRGSLPQNAHPEDLRAKLLESGWFEQVVLDEQTPDKNKRNVTVRVSLILKDHLRRSAMSSSMLGLKIEKDSKPNKKSK